MFLSDLSIRRPVFTTMMSFALIVLGILSYFRLPVDQYPPVNFPVMLVQTVYPGASPNDIERDITRPLEDAVASAPGLDELQSFSRDNVSVIVLQFKMGTDLTDAVSIVRDRIGGVAGELPTAAEDPIIRQVDIAALPVMIIALASPAGVNATRDLADERLRPFLEQVSGVGSVNILGGQDREIRVDLDLDAMASVGATPMQVVERIGWENLSLPVGQFEQHGFAIGVRAEGRYQSVKDLRESVVHTTADGRSVRLSEIAQVDDTVTKPEQFVSFNGQEAVSLEIVKRSGANTVEVARGIEQALQEVIPTLGAGVTYDIIADQSKDIEANAHEVWVAIGFGGAMAILVILFFLLDIRGTLISAIALPTSVIGTFAAMAALGFSINTMSLLGLSLAIGLLIDDAVVVREAITRRLEAGDSPAEAASRGTKEIALAVLATTLSLVAVFVPVAFMSGIVGQFFMQFGITISVSVLLSLFVAFTLDPMLSARLSVRHVHGVRRGIPARWIERFLDSLDHAYRYILDGVLNWRRLTILASFLILAATVVVGLFVPVEFVPKEDRGEVLVELRLPVGTSLDSTREWSEKAEQQMRSIPGVQRVYTIMGFESRSNQTRFRIKLIPKSERSDSLEFFQQQARQIAEQTPGSEVTISEPSIIEGLGDWPPLMIIVQGADLDILRSESERIQEMLQSIPGTSDVRLSLTPGRPELHLNIDRALAADRGVPSGVVASTARLLVEGNVVGTLSDGGMEADIRVRAHPRYSEDAVRIAALPMMTPRGLVSLGEIAKVDMGAGASEIQRTDRSRSITISVQVGPGGNLGQIVDGFKEAIEQAPLKEGYFYSLSGQARDMEETTSAMLLAVAIALIFIFMVLASQFESLAHPFTLLMSVPLAMIGAVLALFVTRNSFSMGSQIGLILLMGLVTKNAILLVDGALQNIQAGMTPLEAIRQAGPRRLRPILMTSVAMIFGMIPTAIGGGVGAEFRAPMAITVIGGVISSTFLTLLVVPIVFLWVEKWRVRLLRLTSFITRSQPESPS